MEHHHQQPPSHPHQQQHLDMEPPALANAHYGFYTQNEGPDPSYGMHYPQQMPNYEIVHNAPQPQGSFTHATELHPALQFRGLNLVPNQQYPPQPGYPASPPNLPNLPISSSSPPPPQSPTPYDPLSPPVSGSDTSNDGSIYNISRNSSVTGSPSSSRANSLVHRNSLRYNPTPSPTGSSGRRRGRSFDSDEDDPQNMMHVVQDIASIRKEATRRQRIEAEQRRRDELRDGYARLKDVLPVSNQKSSKVSLLERATNYIIHLDKTTRQMQQRLAALESEVQRLRSLNEKISLSVGSTPEASANQTAVSPMERPLSPPPESTQPQLQHSLIAAPGDPTREDSSGSGSEGGF